MPAQDHQGNPRLRLSWLAVPRTSRAVSNFFGAAPQHAGPFGEELAGVRCRSLSLAYKLGPFGGFGKGRGSGRIGNILEE